MKAQFAERKRVGSGGDALVGTLAADWALDVTELREIAHRHGLAAVHVIHNEQWGVIGAGQRRAGFEFGTSLEGADYADIARAFGCHGERITRREEVAPALDRALSSGLPAVIDARVRFEPHPGLPRFAAAGRR